MDGATAWHADVHHRLAEQRVTAWTTVLATA